MTEWNIFNTGRKTHIQENPPQPQILIKNLYLMGKNREKIKQKYILRLIHYIAQKIQ